MTDAPSLLNRAAQRAVTSWFIGVFVLFFARGLFYATWSTRGPQLRDTLSLDLAAMGWYAACLSAGSITGVLVAEAIVRKIGPQRFSVITYLIMGGAFALLGVNLMWEAPALAFVVTFLLGIPFGASDYTNNHEAARINHASTKNRVPALHGGYSAGVLLGAALVGLVITANIGITPNFIVIGVVVAGLGLVAAYLIRSAPSHGSAATTDAASESADQHSTTPVEIRLTQREVWRDARTRTIGFIGFSFVFAEGVGAVWIPISLVQFGFSAADAAFGYTLYGLGFVVMRFIGGPIADRIGRRNVVLYSALTLALGVAIFVATPVLHAPLLGVLLWGLGDSIGLAMCVAALGDDPQRVSSRMTFLMISIYIANVIVGPVIGLLAGTFGLIGTLLIPGVLMLASAALSSAVKPISAGHASSTP